MEEPEQENKVRLVLTASIGDEEIVCFSEGAWGMMTLPSMLPYTLREIGAKVSNLFHKRPPKGRVKKVELRLEYPEEGDPEKLVGIETYLRAAGLGRPKWKVEIEEELEAKPGIEAVKGMFPDFPAPDYELTPEPQFTVGDVVRVKARFGLPDIHMNIERIEGDSVHVVWNLDSVGFSCSTWDVSQLEKVEAR